MNAKLRKIILENEGDRYDILSEVEKFIELQCKLTAKNVRHKACEICNEFFKEEDHPDSSSIVRGIMNLQFEDIRPKK